MSLVIIDARSRQSWFPDERVAASRARSRRRGVGARHAARRRWPRPRARARARIRTKYRVQRRTSERADARVLGRRGDDSRSVNQCGARTERRARVTGEAAAQLKVLRKHHARYHEREREN